MRKIGVDHNKIVDVSCRHLGLMVHQLCDFEPFLALECSPISWVCVWGWLQAQSLSRHRMAAILLTRFSFENISNGNIENEANLTVDYWMGVIM